MSAREHIFKFGSTYRRGEYFSTANAIKLLGVWRYSVILQQERNIMVSYDIVCFVTMLYHALLYAKMHILCISANFSIATDTYTYQHCSNDNCNRVARYQHLSLLIASNHYFSWNLHNISSAIISCLPLLTMGSKYSARTSELGEQNCVLGCTPSLTIIISVSFDDKSCCVMLFDPDCSNHMIIYSSSHETSTTHRPRIGLYCHALFGQLPFSVFI